MNVAAPLNINNVQIVLYLRCERLAEDGIVYEQNEISYITSWVHIELTTSHQAKLISPMYHLGDILVTQI